MNLVRLYHTLRPLRAVQWSDRLLRPMKARLVQMNMPSTDHMDAAFGLPIVALPVFGTSDLFDLNTGEAKFLNLTHRLAPQDIDWNFERHGKLWAYHLNYFGWLDRIADATQALAAMQNFCRSTNASSIGAEPYPTSRRVQWWIAAMLRHGLRQNEVASRLFADAWRIAQMPEYHLQANHLLQNGFALFAAAQFFGDNELFGRAQRLLRAELHRQFLPDGGHVERSASYAADLCARMIWCLHLQNHTLRFIDEALTEQMRAKAAGLLSWLDAYAFSDGSLAAIGDCSPDMAPRLQPISEAAALLGIRREAYPLHESGYRKAEGKNWQAVLSVGSPAPAYQPGHSHADTLTFCVHAAGKPLIVDPGISTYDRSGRRAWERSTKAHNTIAIDGQSSSDVWASFRVGRRAGVEILDDEASCVIARHDGYRSVGVQHTRSFNWRIAELLLITDSLQGWVAGQASSFLHFHPAVRLEQTGQFAWQADDCRILFAGMASVDAEEYQWAAGFNLLRPAMRLRCRLGAATTEIRLQF